MFQYPEPNKEKMFKNLFDREKYKNILDVGASVFTINLLKKYFPDASIQGINIEIIPRDKIPEITLGNAESLAFKDNSFDLIFSVETLEHVIYPNKFIEEVKRVLKPGGDIILDTPNLNSWSNRILMMLGFPPTNYTPYPGKTPGVPKIFGTSPVWDHPRVFPYRSLKEIFNSNGFKLKRIMGINKTDKDTSFRKLRFIVEKLTPQSWHEITVLKATIEKK
ncbi:MAG: class I SAM-dependent methyltransferase [Candidatus Aenigmarchaeota archaeon]|nr:class I SAM-dependent methyltransferase [Candidatus Aenigmarchaeota archaeon]